MKFVFEKQEGDSVTISYELEEGELELIEEQCKNFGLTQDELIQKYLIDYLKNQPETKGEQNGKVDGN